MPKMPFWNRKRSDEDPDAGPDDEEFARALQREAKRRAKKEEEEAKRLRKEAEEIQKRADARKKQQADLQKHQDRVRSMADELGFDPDREVLEIPDVPDGMEEIERTVIREDLAIVRILYDKNLNEYVYEAIEPKLSSVDRETLEFLRDTLVRTMDGREKELDQNWDEYLGLALEQAVADHDVLIDRISLERIQYYLTRDFLGFGPVDVLIRDSMIEDISCDGPNIPVYLFHRKFESIRTTIVFQSDLELDSFVIRLAQQSGKHISIANPLLDATLPDGSRLQATLSQEVTTRGSTFTVRKFRAEPLTPIDLIHLGTISTELAAYFWFIMEQGASLIMAGGTASGKTTTLNAACQFIPPEKKIVSIEDTREINLQHDNWIPGITRAGFGDHSSGKASGAVDMYDLLGAALRQRPEYLLVGEVRGKEALTLFQAMATGHAVYSTMHADSVPSAVYRLENEPINVPRMMLQTMDVMAIQGQVRVEDRLTRRVMDITEVVGFDPETGDLLTNNVFVWDPETDGHRYLGKSHALEERMHRDNLTDEQLLQEWDDRIEVLSHMQNQGIRQFEDVSKILTRYYRDKDALMRSIRAPPPQAGPRGGKAPKTGEGTPVGNAPIIKGEPAVSSIPPKQQNGSTAHAPDESLMGAVLRTADESAAPNAAPEAESESADATGKQSDDSKPNKDSAKGSAKDSDKESAKESATSTKGADAVAEPKKPDQSAAAKEAPAPETKESSKEPEAEKSEAPAKVMQAPAPRAKAADKPDKDAGPARDAKSASQTSASAASKPDAKAKPSAKPAPKASETKPAAKADPAAKEPEPKGAKRPARRSRAGQSKKAEEPKAVVASKRKKEDS